jgi:hypothetical protein
MILARVPVMPFTEHFARESVPQAECSSPLLKRINRVLSTVSPPWTSPKSRRPLNPPTLLAPGVRPLRPDAAGRPRRLPR